MREMTLSEAWDDGHETGVRDQKEADKEFRKATQTLVDKLKHIEGDPKYQAVWIDDGSQYGEELRKLEQKLNKEIDNGRQPTETNKEV